MVDIKRSDASSLPDAKKNIPNPSTGNKSPQQISSKIQNPNYLISSKKQNNNAPFKKTSNVKAPTNKKEEEKTFIPGSYNPKKVDYPYATKKSFRETLTDIIPPEFIPTEVMGYVFGGLFLLVIILSLFFVPYNQIFSGNITDVNLTVGLPMHFVNLQLDSPEEFPVKGPQILGLIVDSLVFLLIAFIINVIFNYVKKAPAVLSDRDKGKYPRLYNVQKPNYVERITEKVFEEDKPAENKSSSKVATNKEIIKNNSVKSNVKNNQTRDKVSSQGKVPEKIGKPVNLNKLNLKPVKPADDY